MIPKIIHHVWVGPALPSALNKKCIESWKKFLPGYEIKLWNEENIPLDHPFVKKMYNRKKWAFVSDYVRFWVLEKEGGIYLDSDMEVLRSLDEFLDNDAFLGVAKDGYISCGIIGAKPGNDLISDIRKTYDEFGEEGTDISSPMITTTVYNLRERPDVAIYEPTYFYPCNDGERCGKEELNNAYTNHHWQESWVKYARLRKLLRRIGVMDVIKKIMKAD